MARAMKDATNREREVRDTYAEHIKSVNELVDSLVDHEGRGWVPHVAPSHGGVDATVLSVLRDPGPATQLGVGSGFISIENDDPTAERQWHLFASVGVSARDVLPWNAYPWYVNRSLTASERQAGVAPLAQLLRIATSTRVVLLQGKDAQDVWRRLAAAEPQLVAARALEVVSTIHPGRQALFTADPEVRAARIANQVEAFERVGEIVRDIRNETRDLRAINRLGRGAGT